MAQDTVVGRIGTAAAAAGRGAGAVSSSRLAELARLARQRAMAAPEAMRAAQRGEAVDPIAIARLQNTPVTVAEPVVPVVPSIQQLDAELSARPFSKVGKQLLSDADETVIVKALPDGEHFVYPDGVVVDVQGNVVGKTDVGDLTDTGGTDQVDNLAASATDLGGEKPKRDGRKNLTPNAKKTDDAAELAGTIWAATTPDDTSAVSQRTLKQLLNSARKYRNADGTYDPKFLAQINRDPATATARLAALEQMAGVSNADRAAEQIDAAAQARDVANTPRQPAGNRPATAADFNAAKELVGETLPAGNWDALTKRFNELDESERKAVLSALPADTRSFLSKMLDPDQPAPAFLPNLVAQNTRPIDISGVPTTSPSAATSPRGDVTAAAGLVDLVASRVDHQRRMMLLDYSDQIDAARASGDKASVDALIAERDAKRGEFDSLLRDRERLVGIAKKQAEDDALGQMVNLDEAARAAEASGDVRKAAELRSRIPSAESRLNEVRASFEAYTAPAGPSAGQSDEAAFAARAANDQQQAATALRNALLGQDEMVRAEKVKMQQAAMPQAQPAVITPGARAPEFAADEVPDAEMPTAYDEALATANEARLARDRRVVGGGLPQEKRLRAARVYLKTRLGVDPDIVDGMSDKALMEELPLFLKGNDNPIPFEVRSQGSRAGYVSEAGREAINDRIALQDNVNAAHAALDAVEGIGDWRQAVSTAEAALQKAERSAKNASGAASLARASQKVAAAREAYLAALKSNPKALAASRAVDAAYAEMDKAGSGRSLTDRELNRASPAQTYSEVVAGMTGFRNPEARAMNRSSVDLSARERAALVDEADRNFGEDADDLLDEAPSPADEVNLSEGGGRKSRLGGGHPESRAVGSAQAMFNSERFGQFNPMEMIDPDTGLPLFDSEDAVAKEILSRDSQYPAGSEAYGVASDDIADIIRRHYTPGAKRDPVVVPNANDAQFVPDTDGTVVLDDATSSPVIDNLESSATPISPDPLDPVAQPAKPKRGKKATAKPQADGSPIQPVTGRTKTVEEIQSEANDVEREARRQAIDEGYEPDDADQIARSARKKHVDEQMAALKAGAVNPVDGNTAQVGGGKPAPQPAAKPAATAEAPKTDPIDPVSGDGPVRLADEDQIDLPETPKTDDTPSTPDKPVTPDGKPADGTTTPATTKPGLLRQAAGYLKYPAIIGAALTGGGIALDRLGRSGGTPPPDGGGVGGGSGGPGGGGGEFFPMPVGSDGATLMDPDAKAAEEERLNSVLDRIRGRPAINKGPTFQTIQNYNGWR